MPEPIPEARRAEDVPVPLVFGSAALVIALLAGMLVVMPIFGHATYIVGQYDVAEPGPAVHVQGAAWPTGDVGYFLDDRMVAVGHTDEGFILYADSRAHVGGGGGAMPAPTPPMARYAELWVRTGHNTFRRVKASSPARK